MVKDAKNTTKKRTGWIGWTLRGLGVVTALSALAFAGLFAWFVLVVKPQQIAAQKAEAERAAAFARLSGPARRLALYDAFVAQIDRNYYDQSFSGFDWPKMKREWRPRAAAAKDDTSLYTDVFLQMAQRFPSSHMAVVWPAPKPSPDALKPASSPPTAPPPPEYGGEKDVGFQVILLRRDTSRIMMVGEVWPGSEAARQGITPGWLIDKVTYNVTSDKGGRVHVVGTFTALTPMQRQRLETAGVLNLTLPEGAISSQAAEKYLTSLKKSVEYDAPFSGKAPDVTVKRLPSGVLYIRFDHFDKPGLKQVTRALQTAGKAGVILDLRYNGGGNVMPLMDALLPAHTPIYKTRDANGVQTLSTEGNSRPYAGPLVVLTGPASASASEITASVMQTRQRALVVGRPTAGAVLSSQFFPLPDGGKVQVAVRDVETLSGKRLENTGVTPDIVVYPAIEDLRKGKDPALEAAERQLMARYRKAPK